MMPADFLGDRPEFLDFLHSLRANTLSTGRDYSYIGLNFKAAEILSCKLYYTFFGLGSLGLGFPIPELAERFRYYRNTLSDFHINTPQVPGCGITFTIKFEAGGAVSRGVYFRAKVDARPYIEKFLSRAGFPSDRYSKNFDNDSLLKYLSIDSKGKLKERHYIYCNDCSFLDAFDAPSGIAFSQADCLEISTGWSDESVSGDMKFIGISRNSLANPETSLETEDVAKKCTEMGLISSPWFALHGYYLHADVKSVFLFSRKQGERSVLPLAMRADGAVT